MMLLRGSRLSRLVTTISGGHTLVHRHVQRQISTAPICKINAPRVDDKTYVEIFKGQIKFVNGHPDLTAEEKYRNSKRLFAILDTLTSRDERLFLLDKRKPILRVLEQPDITQRRKKRPLRQRVSLTMLARGAHPLRPIITVVRANSPAVQHLFRRAFAGYVATRAHAGTIKKLEAEIKRVNADFSLSANFKYRNSVRLFAMIDHAKSCMEVRALRAKVAPFSFDGILQAKPAEQKACYLADAKEAFQKGRAVSQEIERLQWVVFKLMVFAPRGDVPIKESLIRVPLFARQVFDSAVKRIANRMAMKLLA